MRSVTDLSANVKWFCTCFRLWIWMKVVTYIRLGRGSLNILISMSTFSMSPIQWRYKTEANPSYKKWGPTATSNLFSNILTQKYWCVYGWTCPCSVPGGNVGLENCVYCILIERVYFMYFRQHQWDLMNKIIQKCKYIHECEVLNVLMPQIQEKGHWFLTCDSLINQLEHCFKFKYSTVW